MRDIILLFCVLTCVQLSHNVNVLKNTKKVDFLPKIQALEVSVDKIKTDVYNLSVKQDSVKSNNNLEHEIQLQELSTRVADAEAKMVAFKNEQFVPHQNNAIQVNEVEKNDNVYRLDMWSSTTCPSCKTFKDNLDNLSPLITFNEWDMQTNSKLARELSIPTSAVPVFCLYKYNKLVKMYIGYTNHEVFNVQAQSAR